MPQGELSCPRLAKRRNRWPSVSDTSTKPLPGPATSSCFCGYSHSDARLEDKTKFIDGVMTRKAPFKSLEWPELTVQVVGNNAVVRHLWVSESELDGKVTNTKIGVMQVWQKQDGGWKLLARASWRLPPPA